MTASSWAAASSPRSASRAAGPRRTPRGSGRSSPARGWITSRSREGASSRTRSSHGSAGPATRIPGRADTSACLRCARTAVAPSAETSPRRAPCGKRCAPRGAGRRSYCPAESRPSSRLRCCSARGRGRRRLGPAEPRGSRLVPEAPARSRRRSAPLRLHQLLRGPRPGAQAGDLQALGPPRPRGGRVPSHRRRSAAHGRAAVGARLRVSVRDRS